jgi:lipopolysaccharide transport system permease protein
VEVVEVEGAMQAPVTVIRPSQGLVGLRWAELWRYRELLYFLTWREIKVRYKQTVLGALWALLQPLLTMAVFYLFFGRLGKIPSDGIPYPLFALSALVPWTFFANGLSQASNSLVTNSNLVGKVYFPRVLLPVAGVCSGLVDFLISFVLLATSVLLYGIVPAAKCVLLIPFFLLAGTVCLGTGLWLSALNVKYRDVRHIVPFLVQIWMFASPIAYPSSLLHEPWRTAYGLNPMVGVVEGFRWALLGKTPAPGPQIAISTALAIAVLISGTTYFRQTERHFADII